MKKYFFLSVAMPCIFMACVYAQPTLNQFNSAYYPGDAINTFTADTTGINPGPAGAAQTWDFSSLVIGVINNQSCINPASTPYAASFSDATVAVVSGTSYSYYKVTSADNSFLGTGGPAFTMVYSDPQKLFTYPFAYGSSFNDNVYSSYSVSGTTVIHKGTSQTHADANGTLTLPNGTHSNVLRVKITQATSDSSSLYMADYYTVSYLWYDGIRQTPLLHIYTWNNDIGGVIQQGKAVFLSAFATGMEKPGEADEEFVLYPNPASGQTRVVFPAKENAKYHITLITPEGKQVRSSVEQTQPGGEGVIIDVSDLPAGMYFVQIISSGELYTKKLMVK